MIIQPTYPDRWLRALAIPVWGFLYRNIGDSTPLVQQLRNPMYYVDVAVGTVVTFLIWELNRYLIRRFDRQYSWVEHTTSRLLLQAAVCFGVSGVLITLVIFVYNDLLVARPEAFNITVVFLTDLPMAFMFLLVMHLLYVGMWLVAYHRHIVAGLEARLPRLPTAEVPVSAATPAKRTLLANQGRAQVPVLTEHVAYAVLAGDLCVLKTADNKSYTLESSLENLVEQLPPDAFFRLNRQVIAQHRAIQKVESDGKGRLLVHLQPAYQEPVAVSRKRVAAFREWLNG